MEQQELLAAEDTTKVTGRIERQASSKIQANTIENYFPPLQVLSQRRDKDSRKVESVTKKIQKINHTADG